jgi:hypothetical protein
LGEEGNREREKEDYDNKGYGSLGDQLEGDSTGFDHHSTAILGVILNSLLVSDKHYE